MMTSFGWAFARDLGGSLVKKYQTRLTAMDDKIH